MSYSYKPVITSMSTLMNYTAPSATVSIPHFNSSYIAQFAHYPISELYSLTELSILFHNEYHAGNAKVIIDVCPKLTSLTFLMGSSMPSLRELSSLFGQLTKLILPGCGVNDLTGIAYMRSLKELAINENYIDDLSELSALSSLTTLNASSNVINSFDTIEFLAECPSLKSLKLSNNPICGLVNYRNMVIERLPFIIILDDIAINFTGRKNMSKSTDHASSIQSNFILAERPTTASERPSSSLRPFTSDGSSSLTYGSNEVICGSFGHAMRARRKKEEQRRNEVNVWTLPEPTDEMFSSESQEMKQVEVDSLLQSTKMEIFPDNTNRNPKINVNSSPNPSPTSKSTSPSANSTPIKSRSTVKRPNITQSTSLQSAIKPIQTKSKPVVFTIGKSRSSTPLSLTSISTATTATSSRASQAHSPMSSFSRSYAVDSPSSSRIASPSSATSASVIVTSKERSRFVVSRSSTRTPILPSL